jgi:arginase
MPASAIELIAAPSGLGLSRPDGRVPRVDLLPQALLEAGLGQGLQLVAAPPVRVPAYVPLRDPATGVHNGPGIAAVAYELADRVQAVRAASRFALVLGGDCSILLGALLGVRRSHRVGLIFLDGHTDFWPPEASPLGGVAGMDLWFATGRQGCWRTHCGRRWRQSPRPRAGLLR